MASPADSEGAGTPAPPGREFRGRWKRRRKASSGPSRNISAVSPPESSFVFAVDKPAGPTSHDVVARVRRVLAGGVYVSEGLGAVMIERISGNGRRTTANPIERLSNRELQVLNLIGQGRTTREVAETLNLSVKTVESHRQRIKKKLNLQTSAQLVKFAVSSYAQ